MAKRTGPTNPVLQELISNLRIRSKEQNADIWSRVAEDLCRSTRQRRAVNLSRIDRYTDENDIIVVPGKVLGSGSINHKLTISAYQFSQGAKDKLQSIGATIVPLRELANQNTKGKKIKIIG